MARAQFFGGNWFVYSSTLDARLRQTQQLALTGKAQLIITLNHHLAFLHTQ